MMTSLPRLAARPTEIVLRQASWRDAHSVWRWNNASDVRAVSLDPKPIELDDHQAWYSSQLCAAGHYMWIVQAGGDDVGIVRVDVRGRGVGTVSIALATSARGRGIGQLALRAACQRISALRPGQVLEAWIARANEPSRRCFERCGFEWTRTEERGTRSFDIVCWQAAARKEPDHGK